MKYIIDHDYHIHSKLSYCSNHPEQTKENILKIAKKNNLKKICITDHFWDDCFTVPHKWYKGQNFERISSILPLPQDQNVKFCFGCEAEISPDYVLGIDKEKLDKFDFIIIPTTHLHFIPDSDLKGNIIKRRAELYINRLEKLLEMDLPWEKIGIAHLTCATITPEWDDNWDKHLQVLDTIADSEFERLFKKIAECGAGFELNTELRKYTPQDRPRILRPLYIAKKVGCKFYLGSDAHVPSDFEPIYNYDYPQIVEILDLKESDKFDF